MNEKHIKTLPSLSPPFHYFLHSCFHFNLFGVFGLQIVVFVFITKLQNNTLIKQFVQKAIKRQNVFLLLAG